MGTSFLAAKEEKEALCDRAYTPVRHRHHVFTPLGKTLMWVSIALVFGLTLAGGLIHSYEIRRVGTLGKLLVPAEQREEVFNVPEIADSVARSAQRGREY